jgi:Protein of unknown function (DUF3140)
VSDKSREDVERQFDEAVNMTPKELEDWLETDESQSVGQAEGGESTGHRSGRRIFEILRKRRGDLTDDDLEHMRKVHGYVARHAAQRPGGDVESSSWRYSLMNWGHDPLR